jgi:hypothetical protein
MPFFEPLPPEPEPATRAFREWAPPAWDRPSEAALGRVVPVTHVVGRGENVALAIDSLHVFPTGFVIDLKVLLNPRLELAHSMFMAMRHRLPRLGVEFSDGRRAGSGDPSNVAFATILQARGSSKDDDGIPTEPIMRMTGGGGGGHVFASGIWVFPLPPPGELKVFAEWERVGIPETAMVLDADEIRAAAGEAVTVWQ